MKKSYKELSGLEKGAIVLAAAAVGGIPALALAGAALVANKALSQQADANFEKILEGATQYRMITLKKELDLALEEAKQYLEQAKRENAWGFYERDNEEDELFEIQPDHLDKAIACYESELADYENQIKNLYIRAREEVEYELSKKT